MLSHSHVSFLMFEVLAKRHRNTHSQHLDTKQKDEKHGFIFFIFIVFHDFINSFYKMIPFKIATGFIKTDVQK